MSITIQAEDINDTATNRLKNVKQGLLGSTIAATIRGLFAAAAGYLWDATGSTWRRALGDTSGRAIGAAHDASTTSDRVQEVDPLSSHHYESTLADVTNGTDDTYYYYLDMDGYRDLALQLIIDGGSGSVTVTVEATVQDDGTAQASCDYQDVTNAWFGAANFTASAILLNTNYSALIAKYVRVKVVANTGGANDGDWTIFGKRVW